MAPLPTASKMGLALRCQYPWHPLVAWPVDLPSEAARLGIAWHYVAEQLVIADWDKSDALLVRALAHARLLGGSWLSQLRQMRPHDAVRSLACGCEPEVNLQLGSMRGRADLVWRRGPHQSHPVVRDWKTGNQRLPPVYANAQLAFFACCLSDSHTVDLVTVELAHVSYNGDVVVDRHTFMPFEIDVWRAAFLELPDLCKTAKPQPGEHCEQYYCPLRSTCDALRADLS